MDCNRDEAVRSRGIAEKKLLQQDYQGARKFALKARQLFPDLEGLVQFIAVVDVHVTAHEKLQNGEMNLYGILQSDPSADEASLRKQFRKLALVLHPDKNKAVGAEAAFKFVSEAWTILSDKAKKAAYDKLRNPVPPKPGPQKKSRPAPQSKQTEKPPPQSKQTEKKSRPAPQSKQTEKPPPQSKQTEKAPPTACKSEGCAPDQTPSSAITFWTACPDCELQYEFHIMYKNKNLCCPFCMQAFLARELSVVINGPVIWPQLQDHNRTNVDTRNGPCHVNGYCNGTQFNTLKGNFSVSESSKENPEGRKENIGFEAAYAGKEQVRQKEMDQFETKLSAETEAHTPGTKTTFAMEQKLHTKSAEGCKGTANTGMTDTPNAGTIDTPNTFTTEWHNVHEENAGITINMSFVDLQGHNAPDEKPGMSVNIPLVDLDADLNVSSSKKAKMDVQGSINEQYINGNVNKRFSDILSDMKNIGSCMSTDFNVKTSQPNGDPLTHESPLVTKLNPSMCESKMNCDVPDSDFYVFDNDRTEQHFSAGQLWACYDDDDGFPRFYARIVKVISRQPFKIQYTWLEAHSVSDEVTSWLDSGFSYTCGEFKLGKTLTGDSVCMFSHVMAFEKGQKACFKIFPRNGEVWALYKNWASLKTKDKKHGYELVVVLTDYSEKVGVQVCLLVKVQGFKSVFKQQLGVVYGFLPEQMRSFSHNIPVHRFIPGEVPECIEGCLELDLASTPVN